jgi:hypothetical protein
VWPHKTSLTPQLFTEVNIPSQDPPSPKAKYICLDSVITGTSTVYNPVLVMNIQMYAQTCNKRSLLGQGKSGLLIQSN